MISSNLLLSLLTNTLLAMVVIMPTGMNAMINTMMAMAVVVPVAVVVTMTILHSWGGVCIRLCIWCSRALLWGLSALMCAVPTDAFAVGIFDRTLNVTLSDDGVRKRNVVGETTTPVIDEEVIFLSAQCLPDVRLLLFLLVECDVL